MATVRSVLTKEDFTRGLDGLTARPRFPAQLQLTGIEEVDTLLGGGFPRGSLVELCGLSSSGRTGLCLSLLAEATGQQQACAFVDVSDSLDPMSLAAAGVDVDRLLWVRCGESEKRNSPASGPSCSRTSWQKDLAGESNSPHSEMRERAKTQTGFGWRHPRDQMRGIEFAIPSVVTNSQSNTGVRRTAPPSISSNPGMGVDVIARCAGEQVERDRESSRRGENIRDRRFRRNDTRNEIPPTLTGNPNSRGKPWKRLEQALKTIDLLLHSGGWGVVVLDFGSISWVDARRIPLSTWFRFQRIVEDTPTILVLLGEEPCAKGCASVALRCRRSGDKWSRFASSGIRPGVATLQGFEVEGEVMRSRKQFERSDRARWRTRSLHARSS